jgi:zinc protease
VRTSASLPVVVGGVVVTLGWTPAALAQAAGAAAPPAIVQPANPAPAGNLAAALPTDPRLVTGELPNGLKYVVLRHQNPPGRAAMWIHISSGSLNETDRQRGIAHYLEHMAFNGSENFPPGSVIPFFQSMGLNFGQHQNAFTSFDQTTYQLFFPDTKPETIDTGMKFFGDVMGRLLLKDDEIEKERQVIMEEKRARLSGEQRIQDYVLERLVPGSLIGQRLPIGVEETIMGVQRADFVDYYSRWYTPSNMTVIVVADGDEKQMVEHIAKNFGFGEKKPTPVDQPVGVKPYAETRGIVATDKEKTDADIQIVRVDQKREPSTTVADFRRDLVEEVATRAFNRRIGAKIQKGGVSYLSASATAMNFVGTLFMKSADASGEPGKWRQMLAELGTDVQRARLHGFSQREIADVKAQIIASAEQAVEQEKTMPARVVIGMINRGVATGEPILSAAQELELYKKLLPTITEREAGETFTALFDPTFVTFVAQLPAGGDVPTEAELVSLGKAALDVKPDPIKEDARPTQLLAKLPEPGKFASTSAHEGSGVSTGVLENGVTVHHKFMDIRKDTATATIVLAAGAIQETGANRGVSEVAGLAWANPATSTLSSTNIRDLMTGKKVRVGGGAGMDTMTLSISGSPAELETGFQLAHLLLTDPVVEPATLERWKTAQITAIEGRKKDPQGFMQEVIAQTVFPPSEARTQPLTIEQVKALTVESAQSRVREVVGTAPIEMSVVGDISKERAMELAAKYVGSIGKRPAVSKDTLDDKRTMARPTGPRTTEKTMATDTKVAIVLSGFYASDQENVADTRRLQVASRIISTRMIQKVREEEGLAYSPGARLQPGAEFPGFGVFVFASPTKAEKTARLLEVVDQIFGEFAKAGPTQEEVDVAKKQFANTFDEQMKDPSWWSQRITASGYRNVKMDDVMNAPEFFQKVTPEDVRAAFAKYYTPESIMRVVLKPEGGASPAEGKSGASAGSAAGE